MFETILGLIMASAIFTFSYIAVHLDKEKNGALSIFFIILTLFMVLIGLNLSSQTATIMDANVTMSKNILTQAYTPMVYVVVLVTSYFIIFFVNNILMQLVKGKADREKKGDY